jgi:hypothetical protein
MVALQIAVVRDVIFQLVNLTLVTHLFPDARPDGCIL